MDLARTIHFFFTFFCETPLMLLSIRCIRILRRSEYRNHSFCKIFITSLVVNYQVFFSVLILHRLPGIGFAHWFYSCIGQIKIIWLISLMFKTLIQLSFLLSFLQSVNRFTSLTLSKRTNEKIWYHFYSLILPGCFVFCCLLNIRVLEDGTEFTLNPDNRTFSFTDLNHNVLYGPFWLIVEGLLDLLCNIFVLYQFMRVGTGLQGSSAFENSLFLISFCSFTTHTLNVAMQIMLRDPSLTKKALFRIHLVSNISLDAAIVLPTIFIMVFTREVRYEVRRAFWTLFTCAHSV